MKKRWIPMVLCVVLLMGCGNSLAGKTAGQTEGQSTEQNDGQTDGQKEEQSADPSEDGSGSGNSAKELFGADVMEKAEKIQSLIDENFLFEEDETALSESVYRAMLDALEDPYSVYYTKEEFDQLLETTNGSYCGIGVMVSQNIETGIISVVRVFENTPGQKAGLQPEDMIVGVDGTDISGMELDLIVSEYIKGVEGTEVTINIYRPSTGEYLDLTMPRRTVEIPTVEHVMLEDQIGYVEVIQFDMVTADQFAQAVDDLEAQGMTGLIVDLRGNPGGALDAVVSMMDYILPDNISNYSRAGEKTALIYTEDKNGDGECYSAGDGHQLDLPMVVLVNGNSASASEVFSGTLKDYGWATLVGTQTFGKGIVQNLFSLGDGTGIKLTVSRYFTPSGINIHGTGITPDVEVPLDPELATQVTVSREEDNQLQKAIEMLKTGEGMVPHIEIREPEAYVKPDGRENCQKTPHLKATVADLTPEVFRILEEGGYTVPVQTDSHGDKETVWYHNTQYYLAQSGAADGYQLVGLDYDLGTGDLHTIMYQVKDLAVSEELMTATLHILAEAENCEVNENDIASVCSKMEEMEEGGSFTMETDTFFAQIGFAGGLYMLVFASAE